MSRSDPQFNLRIPADLKRRIEQEAQQNKRSATAEIIARIEGSFLQQDSQQGLRDRLEAAKRGRPAGMSENAALLLEAIAEMKSKIDELSGIADSLNSTEDQGAPPTVKKAPRRVR